MKVATIEFGKQDVGADGKLTEEARTKLRAQLMTELEGAPKAVKDAVLNKLGHALNELTETGDLAALSARFILENLERADNILEGLPHGVKLLAKTGAHGSGRVTFELGQAAASISHAQASIEIAVRDLKHYLECSCSPLHDDGDDAAKAAPKQEPQPS